MDREAVIASVEGSRKVRRWRREEVRDAKRRESDPLGEKAGYLLNIAVHAYPDDSFRAIPCIFSLCRQIRNTRLVDQPVVLSWRSKLGGCRNGSGGEYLWWQGADYGAVSEDGQGYFHGKEDLPPQYITCLACGSVGAASTGAVSAIVVNGYVESCIKEGDTGKQGL